MFVSGYVGRFLFAVNNKDGRFVGFVCARGLGEAESKAFFRGVRLHRAPNGRVYPLSYFKNPGGKENRGVR